MTVVESGIDYEGSSVIGVFPSDEIAETFIKTHCSNNTNKWIDYYTVTTFGNDGIYVISRRSYDNKGELL